MAVASFVVSMLTPSAAQWPDRPDKAIPRLPDGTANLSAPAPRTAQGTLDVSGVWQPESDPTGVPGGVEGTRPLTYTQAQRLLPDTELIEYVCNENQKFGQ